MKKKTLAMTILSVVIMTVVILAAGIRTSLQPESKDFMQFTIPVTVTGSNTEYQADIIHFEPLGRKVTFEVESAAPEGLNTEVIIHIGSSDSASIVKETLTGSSTAKIRVTGADGKDLYLELCPENEGTLSPATYNVRYKLKGTTDSLKLQSRPLMVTIVLLFLAVYLIMETNRNESKYDERQLAARGKAAVNALIITLLCCLTCGLLSMTTKNFPISMYEAGIGSTIIGVTAFMLMCDINDAFFGVSERRSKFIVLSWIMGILALFGAGMTYLGLGKINEITCTGFVVGICFFLLAIELTVKSAIEKKEAADEES